ncbi:choice-of-anchor I family protein [Mesobacterium pallidum]|uniref:choice-of-anchor I family protein n=1 Tax=Mesobacterium pallidum TaxID=2872037 RepID=UPI001EE16972|nr:choice-of-anchor I family protein [Mesobacterium pallidum]
MQAITTTILDTLELAQATFADSGAGEGGSEVVSHHDGKLYVTNGALGRIDVFDAVSGNLLSTLDLSGIDGFDGLNSVSASAAGVAVAVERDMDLYANGVVAFFDLDGSYRGFVRAGNLPDMVTFSKDGTQVFVANEGEPGDTDPAGSITVIDVATMTGTTYGFEAFDAQLDALVDAGVRMFPGKLPSTDWEPEYIAEAGGKLFVTLQEANSVAVFDLATMAWESILPLGTQDHSVVALDASDRDDAINIRTYENLVGLRMPDAIAAAEIGGQTYVLTANEGDDRGDFDEGGDAARVGDILDGDVAGLSIDAGVDTTGLERLTVSIIDGDTDGDGDIDVLHSYGSRSFTIFDLSGNVVFDSGSDFEEVIAATRPANAFNNDGYPSGDADEIDENRSDNKGPEPEAIAVGEVDGKMLAFVGLERDGGVMIYDITEPGAASFVDYLDSSDFGHISPEVVTFIAPEDSASGLAQIAVSYEISGTTGVYDLEFGKMITGTVLADEIAGSIGDDVIDGGNGADMIDANGGDDVVTAGMGADTVLGGAGDDFLGLGFGHDLGEGGMGDDVIKGFMGADTLHGGAGDDFIGGGFGHDLIEGGTGDDVLTGYYGHDTFVFVEGDGDDMILDLMMHDRIDLSATGLGFDDITVTALGGKDYMVAYGAMDDSIHVTLSGNLVELTEDSFLF